MFWVGHGFTVVPADQNHQEIREDPRNPWPVFLQRSSGKRQQGDIACLLDGQGQPALMRRANASQAPRHDLAAFRHKLPQRAVVLVVDKVDLLDTELADFLASKILASTRATFAASTGTTRTRRTTITARR